MFECRVRGVCNSHLHACGEGGQPCRVGDPSLTLSSSGNESAGDPGEASPGERTFDRKTLEKLVIVERFHVVIVERFHARYAEEGERGARRGAARRAKCRAAHAGAARDWPESRL